MSLLTRHRRLSLRDLALPPLEDLACAALFAFFAMQGSIPGIAPAQALEMTATAPSGLTTVGGIAAQAVANGLILFLLLRRPRLILDRIAAVPWLALLAALAIASSLWSIDPLLTLRRSIPFALAGLFAIYFAARFSPPRQLAILRVAMLLLALGTVAVVLLAPSIGLDHSPGHTADWQGVFTQKNACGRMMVLASAVILFGGRFTLTRLASLALFTVVLIGSGSRGAWIIAAALLLLWLAVRVGRRSSPRVRTVLAVAAPAAGSGLAALTLFEATNLAALFGRDATLSGRTAIWAQVGRAIALHPWLGYGYDAFWHGLQGPSLQISAAVHFVVVHAHNGFLEIALELGAAGLVLFLLTGARAARQLWFLWIRGPVDPIAFPLAVLFLIVLCDLDENTLLLYNGLFWILTVAALVTLDSAFRDQHHTPAADPHAILSLERRPPRRFAGAAARENP
ncbi:MAG TPA: O-antigen ligase [Acidobacteriaceae bacterium]|jgi:O-antigen ligase|nr:O-antigen ligase [Acidobacteriaceae bacterium]